MWSPFGRPEPEKSEPEAGASRSYPEPSFAHVDPDEQAELDELAVMLERDPWITQAKFSRFQVEEARHENAEDARLDKDERGEQHWYNEQAYLARGQQLQEEARQAAARKKETLAAHRQTKKVASDTVRADVAALKERQAVERRAHQARGHAKVMATQEQKEKIPQQRAANRRRSQAIAQQSRRAKAAHLQEGARVRAQILAENREEVQAVREQTSAEVMDAAQSYAFTQRKGLASDTRAMHSRAAQDQAERQEAYRAKAAAAREAAAESKRNARLEREAATIRNQAEAAKVRRQQAQARHAVQQQQSKSGGSLKQRHDAAYSAKFVQPQRAAAIVSNSPLGARATARNMLRAKRTGQL
jgi:hypothetical protein